MCLLASFFESPQQDVIINVAQRGTCLGPDTHNVFGIEAGTVQFLFQHIEEQEVVLFSNLCRYFRRKRDVFLIDVVLRLRTAGLLDKGHILPFLAILKKVASMHGKVALFGTARLHISWRHRPMNCRYRGIP